MTPDIINGLFEWVGSIMIWCNIYSLWRAKAYKGVQIGPTLFFGAWGLWNLFYYPHLGQWFSFCGGCSIVVANLGWAALMAHFNRSATTLATRFAATEQAAYDNLRDLGADDWKRSY